MLRANRALPEAFRGLSEVYFRLKVTDADRGPSEARKEGQLRRSAYGPFRSTVGPLRPTEDILR